MDARDRLRQYLEQRRELGESEFVLDGLSIEEAMRALGVAKDMGGPAARAPRAPDAEASPARRAAAEQVASGSSDWREALRSVGVNEPGVAPRAKDAGAAARPDDAPPPEPAATTPAEPKVGRFEMPGPPPAQAGAVIPTELKPGLVVGSPMADLLAGPLAHLDSIDAVARAVTACTACGLYKTAKNPVPGEGSAHARFICVGEAPGATEDETGRPFVGQAGQLLTKILGAIDFKREDVFICNVLKHRPPGNRNPAPDEIKACSPYLLRQLELLQPRVILALGTFAAQTLLQTTLSIGKLRGQVHRYYGVPLIVTYHPAALLRNPSWKRPTWEDVQLARRIFDNAANGA